MQFHAHATGVEAVAILRRAQFPQGASDCVVVVGVVDKGMKDFHNRYAAAGSFHPAINYRSAAAAQDSQKPLCSSLDNTK
jgi:hypothetical protein